jgi:YVTN family beta-propeller protein
MLVTSDMTTHLLRRIAPIALACAGCSTTSTPHKAYVGLFGDNAVAVVDTDTSKVLATIPVAAPDGLVLTPDGAKVYVSSGSAGVIDVIDTATARMTTSIPVGAAPAGLAITRDGRYLVAAVQGDGKAVIIDTTTDAVTGSVAIGKAHNSALSADGQTAYVASQVATAPAIDLVGVTAVTTGATFSLDKTPRALATLAGKLYVTVAGADTIEVLDAATGQAGTPIPTAGSPHDIRPAPDGTHLLTVSQTAGELEVIDPSSAGVVAHVPTGKMPHWIALASDGKLAYVTNEGDNNLVAIDLATNRVVKTISVGAGPRKIAVLP